MKASRQFSSVQSNYIGQHFTVMSTDKLGIDDYARKQEKKLYLGRHRERQIVKGRMTDRSLLLAGIHGID